MSDLHKCAQLFVGWVTRNYYFIDCMNYDYNTCSGPWMAVLLYCAWYSQWRIQGEIPGCPLSVYSYVALVQLPVADPGNRKGGFQTIEREAPQNVGLRPLPVQ